MTQPFPTSTPDLALRNESLLRALVAASEDAIIGKDMNSLVTSWNEGAEQLFGYTADEIIGRSITLLFPPDRLHEEEEIIARISRGERIRNLETERRHKDGHTLHVSVAISPIRDTTGAIVGAFKIARDISALRRSQEASHELSARLAKISRLVPGMIYQYRLRPDGTSCFPYASEGIQQIYRVSPEQVQEDAGAVFAVLHPEDIAGTAASIQESARTLQPWHHRYRVKFPNGDVRWLEGASLPERQADGGTVWHGFITDITERQAAEEERRRIESKLVESAKLESLGVLAGGIAHDFNNLLTGILGNASLARLDLTPSSPGLPMIDQIETAARRAADLCKQMLAYSGKGRFVVQRLDLNKLIEDTTHLLQISIAKNCVLRFNLAPALPAVNADATQLRQVIMNLVINASEAIGSRSGVLALTTGVARVDEEYLRGFRPDASPAPGDYVFIEVSDNGCGMDAATLGRIFDPFFTTKFTGRGLGLAAVLGIVRGHKGGLKVYSEVGRGTTFKLFLPVAAGRAQDSATPFPEAGHFRGAGRVLVADDEETVRTVAARMLERLGFEAVLASDGREAVDKYRADPDGFVLVLLDLTMPHLDGEGAFRQLRQIRPNVRVILTSGFNQQEAINRFTGKGLAGFVQKPFELATLTQVIRGVMEQA